MDRVSLTVAVRVFQSPAFTIFSVIRADPIPTHVTPAVNHFSRFSSDGSTPPVGMMLVHGHGPLTALTNDGPPTALPGNDLHYLGTELFGLGYLGKGAASGYPEHLPPVAYPGHIGIQDGRDNEVGAHLHEDGCCGGIRHRACPIIMPGQFSAAHFFTSANTS